MNGDVFSVLIVDDHQLFCDGVRHVLERNFPSASIAAAHSCTEARSLVLSAHFNLMFVDINLPDGSGLDLSADIRRKDKTMRILILSMYDYPAYVRFAVTAGLNGYLLKSSAGDMLLDAIARVRGGGFYLDPSFSPDLLEEPRDDNGDLGRYERLSNREQEVFRMLAEGSPLKEIAKTLNISVKTAETHKYRIYEKLDLGDEVGIIKYALRIGILDPDEWKNRD